MSLEARLRRLEALAKEIATTQTDDEITRLLESEDGDSIKSRWRMLVFHRYLVLHLLANGGTPTGDLAEIEGELARLRIMHPLAIPEARRHLLDVGLFDDAELTQLDEFALHSCIA